MLLSPLHPPKLQKARGKVRVSFARRRGETRLADLFMSGSAKVMLPRCYGAEPQAVIVNTAGGLTGGDVFTYDVELGAEAVASVTTQTAERAYRASADRAVIETRLTVGDGAVLHYLPQETILFEGSALRRQLRVDLAETGRCLIIEPLVLGRAAMGEVPDALSFEDSWRIYRAGALVHAEETRIVPPLSPLRQTEAGLGANGAMATVVYVGQDAADRLDAVRGVTAQCPARAAASAWSGKLVVRVLAADGQRLRSALMAILPVFRNSPLPRVWTM